MQTTLNNLLATGADEAAAISAPGRRSLSYQALRALVDTTLGRRRMLTPTEN